MSLLSKTGHDLRGAEIRLENGELDEDFTSAVEDWKNQPLDNEDHTWRGGGAAVV